MNTVQQDEIRQTVRQQYGQVAEGKGGNGGTSCCGSPSASQAADMARVLGYSADDASGVPEGANMGLGCGNPQVIAGLKSGEPCSTWGAVQGSIVFLLPGRWVIRARCSALT